MSKLRKRAICLVRTYGGTDPIIEKLFFKTFDKKKVWFINKIYERMVFLIVFTSNQPTIGLCYMPTYHSCVFIFWKNIYN